MVTVNSTLAEIQAVRGTDAGAKLLPSDCGGRVRIARGSYTPAFAAGAGTVVNLTKLPKGARVLDISKLCFEAGQGASTTVKVGDSKDDDRYLTAVAPGAGRTTKTLDANALGNYVLPEEDFIILTVGTAALTANKAIAFEIYYVID